MEMQKGEGLRMTFRGRKGNLDYVLNTQLTPSIVDRNIMNTNLLLLSSTLLHTVLFICYESLISKPFVYHPLVSVCWLSKSTCYKGV